MARDRMGGVTGHSCPPDSCRLLFPQPWEKTRRRRLTLFECPTGHAGSTKARFGGCLMISVRLSTARTGEMRIRYSC